MKSLLYFFPVFAVLTGVLTGCSPKTDQSQLGAATGEIVELRFGSDRADRTSGMGWIEEQLAAEYMRLHPNVRIVFEIADDGVYTRKLQVWKSLDRFPDIFMNWTDAGRFFPMASQGYLLPLDPQDYADLGFFDGALHAFRYQGTLYGLTRNTDVWVLMVNRRIFREAGLSVPKSIEDLPGLAKNLRARGIAPIAMNGLDKWNLVNIYAEMGIKYSGGHQLLEAAIEGKTQFSKEPALRRAADQFQTLVNAGVFQNDYLSSDYNGAKTAFIEGRTAMYYMGTFELGILSDSRYTDAERKEIGAILFPGPREAPERSGDVMGRFGGGYCIWARTPHPEIAKDFLAFFFQPDRWARMAWQLGVATPAQEWNQFSRADELPLLQDITQVLSQIRSRSGMFFNERINATFAEYVLDITVRFAAGKLSSEGYLAAMDQSAAENRGRP